MESVRHGRAWGGRGGGARDARGTSLTAKPVTPRLLEQTAIVDSDICSDRIAASGDGLLVVGGEPVDNLLRAHWLPRRAHRRRADHLHAIILESTDKLLL